MKRPLRASHALLVGALGWLVLLAGCGGEATDRSAPEGAQALTVVGGETREDGEKGGYALDGEEIVSDPGPTIRVKDEEPVEIRFENRHGQFHGESIPHDFVVVKDKDVPDVVTPGNVLWGAQTDVINPDDESELITFTPDRPGEYYYVCSVFGHIGRGMWGRFVVDE